MEKQEEVDRRRGGEKIFKSVQGCTLAVQLGQRGYGID